MKITLYIFLFSLSLFAEITSCQNKIKYYYINSSMSDGEDFRKNFEVLINNITLFVESPEEGIKIFP